MSSNSPPKVGLQRPQSAYVGIPSRQNRGAGLLNHNTIGTLSTVTHGTTNTRQQVIINAKN